MKASDPPGNADPPGNELAALLWVLAVLIGVFELVWWFSDRIYSA